MGRAQNPVTTHNTYRRHLAFMLRELLAASGLTFQQLAARCEDISRPTLQRAASGDYTPKEKTLKAFAAGCGFPDATDVLLRLRISARIEDRGQLPKLGTALHPSLISDERDLSRAIEYLYEAAGAPRSARCGTRAATSTSCPSAPCAGSSCASPPPSTSSSSSPSSTDAASPTRTNSGPPPGRR
ncbi:helix-turn-helix transcriptional regulator [Streptomyces sp. SM1P]